MVAHAAVTGECQDRMFYTGLAVVAAAVVFAGFAVRLDQAIEVGLCSFRSCEFMRQRVCPGLLAKPCPFPLGQPSLKRPSFLSCSFAST
jgi:hypothetical protein